jgi:peptidoglycan hydrolase-like protein with peptidoglycan-binding domain
LQSLQAQLAILQSQAQSQGSGTATSAGGSASSYIFTRNLSLFAAGPDVMALQRFLIAQNSGPAARRLQAHGVTQTFGILTYQALVEFQIYAGISPASGYFGPITRARVQGSSGNVISVTPVSVTQSPVTSSSPSILSPSTTGLNISTLQNILLQSGYLSAGTYTQGAFDSVTVRAVETFQCIKSIACSASDPGYGTVGPKTRAALGM